MGKGGGGQVKGGEQDQQDVGEGGGKAIECGSFIVKIKDYK